MADQLSDVGRNIFAKILKVISVCAFPHVSFIFVVLYLVLRPVKLRDATDHQQDTLTSQQAGKDAWQHRRQGGIVSTVSVD